MAKSNIIRPSKASKPFMGTREEARAVGAVRYIDGLPCGRNHNPTIRLVSNSQCVDCRDLKQAEIIANPISKMPHGFIPGEELRGKPIYQGTLAQARKAGAMYYIYTRNPCNKGHDPAIRLTSTTGCVLCQNVYHDTNKDEINAAKKQDRIDRPEFYSEKGKARYASDPEYFKAHTKSWTERHKEQKYKKAAEWQANHPERMKKIWSDWTVNNPEAVAAKVHKRRARKLGSTEHFTKTDSKLIAEMQGHACAYCWKPLVSGDRAHDHFIPLARGGSNGQDNIIHACGKCNRQKSSRMPVAFIKAERDRLLKNRLSYPTPNRALPLLPILQIIDDLLY